jgi:hypothetical protein
VVLGGRAALLDLCSCLPPPPLKYRLPRRLRGGGGASPGAAGEATGYERTAAKNLFHLARRFSGGRSHGTANWDIDRALEGQIKVGRDSDSGAR